MAAYSMKQVEKEKAAGGPAENGSLGAKARGAFRKEPAKPNPTEDSSRLWRRGCYT
jgi:hypothetical protein